MERLIRVGITQGDINGVGYEVLLKMLEDTRLLEICTPVVYGSGRIASYYRKMLDMPAVPMHQINSGADIVDGGNNMVNVISEEVKIEPGVPTAESGKAAFISLERAVADLKEGYIDVLVTLPINKLTIQNEHFHFPGHTEYLEASYGDGNKALMVLSADNMRVALVTTHMPLSQVPTAITTEGILEKLRIFNGALARDYGIGKPRIAVLSLNPHSGEGGMLGNEESDVIMPAIEKAQNEGILAFGPYAADGFFGAGHYVKFDGILAMYHDQGLAPFKALAMEAGVNYTAGLPYVRTSPDHGTGYDIAGSGEASCESLRAAVYAAIDIFRNRATYDECRRRPLRKQYVDKRDREENMK